MGWGSKQTTTSSNTNKFDQSTTPIEQAWAAAMRQQLGGQVQNQITKAQQPIFGASHQAQYLNNLNDLANMSTQKLTGALASQGQLGAGSYASGMGGIERERFGKLADFYGQLPFQEAQAQQARLMPLLGMGLEVANSAPVGQRQFGEGTQTGFQEQKTNPGLAGLVGSLAGMAASAFMPGLGSMMGLGSKAAGAAGGAAQGMAGMGGPFSNLLAPSASNPLFRKYPWQQ